MAYKQLGAVFVLALLLAVASAHSSSAGPDRVMLYGHVPSGVAGLTPKGRLPPTNHLRLAIGLPLRNQAALDELLQQIYNPQSTSSHKFLKPDEFAAQFGPTEQDYQAVIQFAEANGLSVVGKHSNRVVLDVRGGVSNIEQAFNITLRTYQHPTEARECFAPDTEPSVPANLPVVDMWGLSDYSPPRPLAHKVDPLSIAPLNYNGSGAGGAYQGSDFRNAYAPGTSLVGAGQIAAVAEFDGYYANDITSYESQCGYTNVPLQNVLLDSVSGTPGYSGVTNAVAEVSLDIELIIAMAPGLSKLMVYEGSSPYDVFNKMVTDNLAKQISCSWAWGYGPTHNFGRPGTKTLDSQLKQMAAQGQSFFQASGDSDAYTGTHALSPSTGPIPADSIYVTSVGGTTLTMNGIGASWSSETVWNWGGNVGSGGGISPNYKIPSWQTNVSMAANSGSTVNRNIPDVALTADAVHVVYNNGSSAAFGGTSCAAPLWAGFCALANQQSSAAGGTTVGFLNPALYTIAAGASYTNCFHDITTGNNIGNDTPGLFYAVPNYDLATGLGTPNGTNLINALAPPTIPYFITQPSSQTVTAGTSLTFSATVAGQSPLSYRWQFNGTNLPAGGNVSGTTSNVLSITAATTNNSGNYQIIASNSFGSVTSVVAALAVVLPPAITGSLIDQAIECGGNITFNATVSGTAPLSYQWSLDGTPVSSPTNTSLSLTNVHLPNHTVALVVTNLYGSAASNVVLTVHDTLPPVVTLNGSSLVYVELGSAFTDPGATANDACSGAVPVVANGIVNTSAVGTNTLVYTAGDGSGNTNTAARTVVVRDTTPPTLALNSSANPSGYQDALNFTAAVTPTTATGTIQFLTNGAAFDTEPLIAGQATSTNFLWLPRDTNLIVAAYSGDANVLPSTNTLLQIVTNHPPIAAPAFYSRAAGSALEIAIADLATNWTDVDGDIISLADISVSTNGGTLTNNAGILVYFNANDVDDQFVCTINDGFGGTNSQIVSIDLDRPANPTPTIVGVGSHTAGSFTLQLTGAPGDTCVLEATASFVPIADWQPVATNTLDASGAWQFNDTQATNILQRFYRLRLSE